MPMLPFLSLPIIFTLDAARRFWQRATLALLAAASIVAVWMDFLPGQNFPPETTRHPIADHALPFVRLAELRSSLGSVMGLRGFAALIPQDWYWWRQCGFPCSSGDGYAPLQGRCDTVLISRSLRRPCEAQSCDAHLQRGPDA